MVEDIEEMFLFLGLRQAGEGQWKAFHYGQVLLYLPWASNDEWSYCDFGAWTGCYLVKTDELMDAISDEDK